MPFDADHLRKPFRAFRKAAKSTKNLDDPDYVHKLRTNARRIEAILGAVHLVSPRHRKALLRALAKIRKAAGHVRDLDVLTGKAADVLVSGERNCQVRLLEYLGAERQRKRTTLARALKTNSKQIRRELQRCARNINVLIAPESGRAKEQAEQRAAARTLALSSRLQHFARLGRRNLHHYRKQGKQLRYVLQAAKPQDDALVQALREMQDAIGEWHDWEELLGIAKGVLDHGRKCGMLHELQLHADTSFDEALRLANSVRKRFFTGDGKRRRAAPAPLRIVRASAQSRPSSAQRRFAARLRPRYALPPDPRPAASGWRRQ